MSQTQENDLEQRVIDLENALMGVMLVVAVNNPECIEGAPATNEEKQAAYMLGATALNMISKRVQQRFEE